MTGPAPDSPAAAPLRHRWHTVARRFTPRSTGQKRGADRRKQEEVIVQLMIWFALYVVLVLALATWRSHHDSATRARKNRNPGRGSTARPPVGRRERHTAG